MRVDSIEVINPETSKNLGMRIVRDTILIEHGIGKIIVKNKRWKIEDFGDQRWISMEHADDRPFQHLREIWMDRWSP